MRKITDLLLPARGEWLNKVVGPLFRAEEFDNDGRFDGWRIVKVGDDEAPSFIRRDLFPYAKVSPIFEKLTVFSLEGPAEGGGTEGEDVLQMLQKLWTSVREEFGIEMATSGFEPLK